MGAQGLKAEVSHGYAYLCVCLTGELHIGICGKEFINDVLDCQHGIVVIGTRLAVNGAEHRGEVNSALERYVLPGDGVTLFFREPVALALQHFVAELGVELGMVNGGGAVDGALHLHADETARSCGIGEWVQVIGCADEGCVALVLLYMVAVGGAVLDIGLRQEVLEQWLLGA